MFYETEPSSSSSTGNQYQNIKQYVYRASLENYEGGVLWQITQLLTVHC